jgi:hypothetical protein
VSDDGLNSNSSDLGGSHAVGRRPYAVHMMGDGVRIVQARRVLIKFLVGNIMGIEQISAKLLEIRSHEGHVWRPASPHEQSPLRANLREPMGPQPAIEQSPKPSFNTTILQDSYYCRLSIQTDLAATHSSIRKQRDGIKLLIHKPTTRLQGRRQSRWTFSRSGKWISTTRA